jgi:hypothetical protein
MSNKAIQELYPIGTELVVKDECVMIYIKEKTLTIGKKYVVLDNSLDDCIMIVNDQGHSHKFPIEDVCHFFDVLPKSEDTPQESTPSKQLTAVEWLFRELVGHVTNDKGEFMSAPIEKYRQALAMQRDHLFRAYSHAYLSCANPTNFKEKFEEFYNSLYGKEEKQ